MSDWIRELRVSVRSLFRDIRFTSLVLLYLVLGIGGNAIIFTAVDNMVLDNLPDFEDAKDLVVIWDTFTREDGSTSGGVGSSPMTYFIRKEQNRTFEDIAAVQITNFTLTGAGDAEDVRASSVTHNMLPMLGVKTLRGRHFTEEEGRLGGDNRVAILNERLWRTRFGGSDDVVGKPVMLDGESFTVIGIIPGRFQGLNVLGADIWVPLALDRNDSGHTVTTVGRLKPGTHFMTAEEDLLGIAEETARLYPESHGGWGAKVRLIHRIIISGSGDKLIILQMVTLFILLLVCVNIGTLFLARSEARLHETAVRTALGAGRGRILRQMFTESLVLSFAGGALALGAALLAIKTPIVAKLLSSFALVPRQFFIKPSVIFFIFLITLLVAVFFSLVPAFRTWRLNQVDSLKGGGVRGGSRKHHLLNALVIAEIALAIVMLSGAGLMLRSMSNLDGADPGFEKDDRLMAQVRLPRFSYEEPLRRATALNGMMDRIRTIPGVEKVSITTRVPLYDESTLTDFNIEGQPPEDESLAPKALTAFVSYDFLEVMGIPLLEGRTFRQSDNNQATNGVAVINQNLAKRFWPDGNPLGARIQPGATPNPDVPYATVIGIVDDIHFRKLDMEQEPILFISIFQALGYERVLEPRLVLESSSDPRSLVPAVRTAIREVDPVLTVQRIAPLEEVVAESYDQQATGLVVIGLSATLALLLAAIGVYGMISYIYARRTREIGVHIAVGALPKDVIKQIVKHGARLALIGLVLGLFGGFLLGRLLQAQLFNVGAADPPSLIIASVGLVAVALAASFLSARRATKIDPMAALRQE